MRFLVVDDSKLSRMKLTSLLHEIGHEVVGVACDGLEAIEKAKELSPDFITMDLEMPNMKGDESAKRILEIHPQSNIILITSIVNQKEIINAIRIGIKKFLQKPVEKEKLQKLIVEVVMQQEKEVK